LRECMGGLAERFEAHGLDKLRAEWWYATVLPANWKLAMEAFMEGYHVARTHPQLHSAASSLYNSMYGQYSGAIPHQSARDSVLAQFKHLELVSEGMAGMVHAKEVEIARQLLDVELPEDPDQAVMTWYGIVNDQISKQLGARGEPVPDLNAVAIAAPLKAVEFIFPHFFLLPYFTSMSSYRIRPLGPESCMFELWSLTMYPEGKEPEPVMQPVMLPYDSDKFPPIPRQDYSNIPRQQIGLHAGGFEFMRLSKNIEGLISNYQRLIDYHLQCAPPHRLSKAMAALSGGFDGPILDMAS
jgi:carnitine monooxygenase subunit